MKRGKIIFIFLFVIISLFLNLVISTDPPATEWNSTYDYSSGTDVARAIQQTSDGGYVVTGHKQNSTNTNSDIWIMKIDSSGNHLWNVTYDWQTEDISEESFSIKQTTDGGFIVLGIHESTGPGILGETDIWIIKTNSTGGHVWNETHNSNSGSPQDEAYSIIETSDGGYALVGFQLWGASTMWAIKTNSTGGHVWNKTYAPVSQGDTGYSIIETSDGGYAIAGTDVSDVWLVKTNTTGDSDSSKVGMWNVTFDGGGTDIGYSLRNTTDGGYIIAGTNGSDVWVIKTNSTGGHEWNQTYDFNGKIDTGRSIISSESNYIIVGEASNDTWIIKINSTGGHIWNQTLDYSGDDNFYEVVISSNPGYIAAGTGNSDFLIVKLESDAVSPDLPPNTTLIRPANNNLTRNGTIDFSCNASDDFKLRNISLYVWNLTGEVNYTNTISVNGTFNQTSWNVTFEIGNYSWNCLAYDNLSNGSWAASNFSFEITTDTTPPSVVFVSQFPADMDTFDLFIRDMNATYNITDDTAVDASTVTFYYKTNNSVNDIWIYTNGSITSSFLTENVIKNNYSEMWNFTLQDNNIYPATYNFNELSLESTVHSAYDLDRNNEYVKIRLFNVTNAKNYSVIEAYVDNQTAASNSLRFFYCNYTFTNGNPIDNESCINFYNLAAAEVYNHTHTIYSKHHTIPFAINTSNGMIGDIYVTSISYFVLIGRQSDDSWNIYYTENVSRPDSCQYSTTGGETWTNLGGTYDFHLHQYDGSETFWYYVCANDTAGNENCTIQDMQYDLIDLAGIRPIAPEVYNPTDAVYSGNITINYTASLSPNSYPIAHYNISLVYVNETFAQTIRTNNSLNLSYIFNSSDATDGLYKVRVEACDNLSQCSYGYSANFSINNNPPIITSVSASPSDTTATISWTTDETSNSTVYYGTTTPTPAISGSTSFVISHSISLSGLSASTFYYFNVSSCDAAGNCNTSIQYNFTTTAAAVPTTTEDPGGGGGATCTSECSDAEEESSCEGTAVRYRVCGNYDADICKEWSDYQYTSCEEDEYCEDAVCIPAICEENWQCDWTDCSDGFSYPQNCIDLNECGTSLEIPTPIQCHIPPMPTIPTTGPGGGGGGGGGASCIPNWKCDKWGDCSVNYSLQDLLQDKTKYEGVQERTCTDGNNCYNPSTQEKSCSLNKQISARKIDWCNDKYVEIYSKKNELVGRIKETKLLTLDKIDIGFMISNFTGYCAYCYDGVKNFDEEEKDCGGPNCPPCPRFRSLSMWIKIIAWILWLLLLILILIIVGVYFREKYRRDLWKRKFRRAWLFLRSGR